MTSETKVTSDMILKCKLKGTDECPYNLKNGKIPKTRPKCFTMIHNKPSCEHFKA